MNEFCYRVKADVNLVPKCSCLTALPWERDWADVFECQPLLVEYKAIISVVPYWRAEPNTLFYTGSCSLLVLMLLTSFMAHYLAFINKDFFFFQGNVKHGLGKAGKYWLGTEGKRWRVKFANQVSWMINFCTLRCRSGSCLALVESRSGNLIRGNNLKTSLKRKMFKFRKTWIGGIWLCRNRAVKFRAEFSCSACVALEWAIAL